MMKPSRTMRSVLAALVVATFVLLGGGAVSAAPRHSIVYDALGDSYASGYGVPPYDGQCGRSSSAYAVQLDGRMKIDLDDFVACAGAKTTDMAQEGQFAALDANTDLVTVTIGGNDIHWSDAVKACLGGSDGQCTGALAATRRAISTVLPGLLDSVYTQISDAAPAAHVLVVGYARLFSPEYGAFLGASPAEQQALNDGADLLNGVIAAAAARHGFGFVDVTKRFIDHGVNAPDAWLLGPFDPAAFHPNAAGYEAYTAAVTASVVPARLR
jgi:lysophospholipase L1-like esterase